ncbi:MAG: DUF421 domain-containing protein [Clostridia bacterium]|nr:DUF421 domain-containing protein [Clostridia bacterium]
MAVTFFRTLIIIITLIVLMRLMGKRQIGEMQPFEFIITLIIADLACIPMADVSIPLVYGIVSIACLFILHQLFSLLEQSGIFFKRIISGKPSLVINKNGVDLLELKKNNLGVDDLIESMRTAGYFSFDDLIYAVYESNGNLSAFENPEKNNSNLSLPLLLVGDGKINNKNVTLIHEQKQDVLDFISKQNSKLKNVEVMTVDGNGKVYFKTKNQKYQILNYTLKEGVQW